MRGGGGGAPEVDRRVVHGGSTYAVHLLQTGGGSTGPDGDGLVTIPSQPSAKDSFTDNKILLRGARLQPNLNFGKQ